MAASLIDTMTEDFDPLAFHDTYREALESLVQAKIEGNEVVRPAGTIVAPEKPSGPADLTETLRASVEAAKASRTGTSAASGSGNGASGDAKGKPAAKRTRSSPGRSAGQDKQDTQGKPASPRRKKTA